MNPDRIRDALKGQPFLPFDLILSDGRSFTITHPDFLAIAPGNFPRDLVFWTEIGANRGEFQTHWVNFNLIVEIAIPAVSAQTPGPRSQGNGA